MVPLNVDTQKSGHHLYTGHFVWSQHNTNMYYFTPEIRTLSSGPTLWGSTVYQIKKTTYKYSPIHCTKEQTFIQTLHFQPANRIYNIITTTGWYCTHTVHHKITYIVTERAKQYCQNIHMATRYRIVGLLSAHAYHPRLQGNMSLL